jgi:hypothetical protein
MHVVSASNTPANRVQTPLSTLDGFFAEVIQAQPARLDHH